MRIELRIKGAAKGKARPRFDPRTRRAINPPSNIISENDVRAVWREAGEPRIEDEVAIRLLLVVVVPRPNTHFTSKGELSATGRRNPVPRKKPDLDNAVKLIMDALNSRAYRDDVAIAEVGAVRVWGEWPESIVIVEPAHDPVE